MFGIESLRKPLEKLLQLVFNILLFEGHLGHERRNRIIELAGIARRAGGRRRAAIANYIGDGRQDALVRPLAVWLRDRRIF